MKILYWIIFTVKGRPYIFQMQKCKALPSSLELAGELGVAAGENNSNRFLSTRKFVAVVVDVAVIGSCDKIEFVPAAYLDPENATRCDISSMESDVAARRIVGPAGAENVTGTSPRSCLETDSFLSA